MRRGLSLLRLTTLKLGWSRAGWAVGVGCLLLLLCCDVSGSEPPAAVAATSSPAARQEAIRSIPLDKLSADAKSKLSGVLTDTTIYRRMPPSMLRCDPELYLFLINRPDTVVNIWDALGLSDIGMSQIAANTYRANDGHGTESDVEYLFRSYDTHVIYAEGSYSGPLFARKLRGKCVLILKSSYTREPTGSFMITHRMDVFVRLENYGADLLAKTLHPVVGKMADRNFAEVTNFLGSLHKRSENDPEWAQKLAQRLDLVRPEVRDDFARLTAKIAEKNEIRRTAALSSAPHKTSAKSDLPTHSEGPSALQLPTKPEVATKTAPIGPAVSFTKPDRHDEPAPVPTFDLTAKLDLTSEPQPVEVASDEPTVTTTVEPAALPAPLDKPAVALSAKAPAAASAVAGQVISTAATTGPLLVDPRHDSTVPEVIVPEVAPLVTRTLPEVPVAATARRNRPAAARPATLPVLDWEPIPTPPAHVIGDGDAGKAGK